jgi:predicted transcriptional regulator
MTEDSNAVDLLGLTTEIVAAHVSNNAVGVDELPLLINEVHRSLTALGAVPEPVVEKLQPAVPVKKSVTPDFIICLEDGKKLKMLKRHLKTAYDMSPEDYRAGRFSGKWGGGGRPFAVAAEPLKFVRDKRTCGRLMPVGSAPKIRYSSLL